MQCMEAVLPPAQPVNLQSCTSQQAHVVQCPTCVAAHHVPTQGFPNAVNQPNFPSVVVQPEDEYLHEVVYKFSSA
jgi:hypothetical protein